MYNKCIHFRIRSLKKKKYYFCVKKKSTIELNECKTCNWCAYKERCLKHSKTSLKQVSKKRAKLERNRRSVFTNDLSKCINCGRIKNDLHECIGGFNRTNSIKYDLVVPLCRFCHEDRDVVLKWKIKAQDYFINHYGYDKYMQVFKINYKEKHKKRTKE